MAGIPFWRRHSRWRDNVSAYVDGELPTAARLRFEAHLEHCEACRAEVAATRQVKLLMAHLPEAPLPRSFRLTPEMVAPGAIPQPAHHSLAPVRIAQFAAGLAVVALITVLTIDLTASSGSSNTNTQAAASRASTESKAASAPQIAPTTTVTRETFGTAANDAAARTPTPTKGPASQSQPGVEGASNGTPTPTPAAPHTGAGESPIADTAAPLQPAGTTSPSETAASRSVDNTQSLTPSATGAAGGFEPTTTPLAPQAPDTGAQPANGDAEGEPPTLPLKGSEGGADHGWYRPVEFALMGFAVLAAIGSILLSRRRRPDDE